MDMEPLTRNQSIFSLCLVLQSIIFFSLLYRFLDHGAYNHVIIASLIFGVTLFLTGFLLGYRDKATGRFSLGFGYHLITYLIVNLIGAIFLVDHIGMGFRSGLIIATNLTFWGIGLAVHYFFAKRNVDQF